MCQLYYGLLLLYNKFILINRTLAIYQSYFLNIIKRWEHMNSLDFLQMPIKNTVIPLNLLTIGSNDQPHLNRPVGLPYHQLFLATKGKGIFRIFGAGDFELLPGEAIIILKGTGHEYYPVSKEVWKLGFVGFDGELADTMLSQLNLKEVKKLYVHAHSVIWENIEQLWSVAKKNGSTVQW